MGGRPNLFEVGCDSCSWRWIGDRLPLNWHSSATGTSQLLVLCARHPVADAAAYSCVGLQPQRPEQAGLRGRRQPDQNALETDQRRRPC